MVKGEPVFERALVDQAQKKHGQGKVQIASDGVLDADVPDYLSTQCATLDYALGRPGVPIGRLTVITGREGSGKTTVGHHLLAETQQRGGTAILFDAENRYDKERAARMGIDHDRLIYVTGDQPLEAMLSEIKQFIDDIRAVDATRLVTIVLDSLAACATEKQMKGEYKPGEVASLISAFLKEEHSIIAARNICFIVINQLRSRIDFMGGGYGPTTTMVAEGSLRYYATVRIDMRQAQKVGDVKDEPTGILAEAFIAKNTAAPPFRKAQFIIDFLHGIDRMNAMLEIAKKLNVDGGILVEKVEGRLSQPLISGGGGGYYAVEGREKKFKASEFTSILDERPDVREVILAAPLLWTKEATA